MSKICPNCHKEFTECEINCSYCELPLMLKRNGLIVTSEQDANMRVISRLNEHSIFLESLYKAILLINLRNCAIEKDGKPQFINERSFAYELYRLWNITKPSHLIVNAEVTKRIEDKFEEKAVEIFGEEKHCLYPDIVLHGGQFDSANQEIICELKVSSNLNSDSLIKDLKKLKAYTTKEDILYHEFKTGVFILVNGDSELIAKKLPNESIDWILTSKIVFVSILLDDWNIIPTIKTPSEIIQIKKL